MTEKQQRENDLSAVMAGHFPFPEEVRHLQFIQKNLSAALAEARASVERMDKEYMDTKLYMAQYRAELDPHELFQNELGLKQLDSWGAFAVEGQQKLAKLQDSPYFARIDFQAMDAASAERFYIGRFAFDYENNLLIYDWRSPVAGMFYDCELGAAWYMAPIGRIEGELSRKRQFKIAQGVLQYAFESAVNIQDDVLQQVLSQTADEKMKSIIATIQKEQNKIIRNERATVLIIQGVAGSGKTSIALHRIAYLLYRFKGRLSAQNIAILSLNKVFADYISNVLPELGEAPLAELNIVEIARAQLADTIDFEPAPDPLAEHSAEWVERVRFKSKLEFVGLLADFIVKLADMVFVAVDYSYGRFRMPANKIQQRFNSYSQLAVKQRLQLLIEYIYNDFRAANYLDEDLPTKRAISLALNKMLKIKNTLALYKVFYQYLGRSELFTMPAKNTLEWADVYPYLYLQAAYTGLNVQTQIKHLLVDEMQDYTPIQYAVLNLLFACPKTILGDFGQCIQPHHEFNLADLRQLYPGAEYVQLHKSYRSTYEIIEFAKRIQPNIELQAVERHGELPEVIQCADKAEELQQLKRKIEEFEESSYVSLAIITKSNLAAQQLYEQLRAEFVVQLITAQSSKFTNGVSITSVQLSKGLEFDEVIVVDVDSYHTEYDRGLLYIACTRALHRLSVLGREVKLDN